MTGLVDGLVEGARGAVGPVALRLEAHEAAALAALHEVHDGARQHDGGRLRGVQAAGAVLDDRAGLAQALSGVDETLPDATQGVDVLAALEQERLARAAGAVLLTHQASGHDAGLVGDEQVARLEVVEDVEEAAVLDGAVLAVQHEQAAGVAGLGRGLGDELVGQRVVKVFSAHVRGPSLMAPPGARVFLA